MIEPYIGHPYRGSILHACMGPVLYVCVCMYVCVYVCVYVYMYVYVCVHVCMYVCMCVYVCMYVCMYIYMYVYMYVSIIYMYIFQVTVDHPDPEETLLIYLRTRRIFFIGSNLR